MCGGGASSFRQRDRHACTWGKLCTLCIDCIVCTRGATYMRQSQGVFRMCADKQHTWYQVIPWFRHPAASGSSNDCAIMCINLSSNLLQATLFAYKNEGDRVRWRWGTKLTGSVLSKAMAGCCVNIGQSSPLFLFVHLVCAVGTEVDCKWRREPQVLSTCNGLNRLQAQKWSAVRRKIAVAQSLIPVG